MVKIEKYQATPQLELRTLTERLGKVHLELRLENKLMILFENDYLENECCESVISDSLLINLILI